MTGSDTINNSEIQHRDTSLGEWLAYEYHRALEAEHAAAVCGDEEKTNVAPKYPVGTQFAIQFAEHDAADLSPAARRLATYGMLGAAVDHREHE
jgi:hypothetical protein